MIVVLTTSSHRYTHEPLVAGPVPKVRVLGYDDAWRLPFLWRATYLFTDADRLGYWELELAARLYRNLRERGCRVLNDPALALSRIGLLQRLQRAGRNSFGAWRLDEAGDLPYPVFLRTDSAHRGVLSDLLADRAQLDAAIAQHLAAGIPARELIIVEYRAEPVQPGLFHKRAMFKVGDTMVPSLGVFESRWCAKHGEMGIAGHDRYEAERQALADLDDATDVRRAFELANVAYGRADYALVNGRVEVYEINTNPQIPKSLAHPFASRRAAGEASQAALLSALAALDEPGQGGVVRVDDPTLKRQRRLDRWVTRSRWRI